ncbi:MAG: hypothetical protein AB7O28_14210 [Vicinamibacterales bacterium]
MLGVEFEATLTPNFFDSESNARGAQVTQTMPPATKDVIHGAGVRRFDYSGAGSDTGTVPDGDVLVHRIHAGIGAQYAITGALGPDRPVFASMRAASQHARGVACRTEVDAWVQEEGGHLLLIGRFRRRGARSPQRPPPSDV